MKAYSIRPVYIFPLFRNKLMFRSDKIKSLFPFPTGKGYLLGSNTILKHQFSVLIYHPHETTTLVC